MKPLPSSLKIEDLFEHTAKIRKNSEEVAQIQSIARPV